MTSEVENHNVCDESIDNLILFGSAAERVDVDLKIGAEGARLPEDIRRVVDEMRSLLREIYDTDKAAIEELRKMGAVIDDLYEPKFMRRIEAVLGLPSTNRAASVAVPYTVTKTVGKITVSQGVTLLGVEIVLEDYSSSSKHLDVKEGDHVLVTVERIS